MCAVPCKSLIYTITAINTVEAITADSSLFFQTARVWPYKSFAAGVPTANTGAVTLGQSGANNAAVTLTSLDVAAGVALATATAHGFKSGQRVTIAGATPAGCNGSFVIYEATTDTFKYGVAGSVAAGRATGTITATTPAYLANTIAAAATTPLVLSVPLGQKRALADLVIRAANAGDGVYVEWD